MSRNETPSTAVAAAAKRQSPFLDSGADAGAAAAAGLSALAARSSPTSQPSAASVASAAATYGMNAGGSPLLEGAATTACGMTTKIASSPSTTSEAAAMSSVRRTCEAPGSRLLGDARHSARQRLRFGLELGGHGLRAEVVLGVA